MNSVVVTAGAVTVASLYTLDCYSRTDKKSTFSAPSEAMFVTAGVTLKLVQPTNTLCSYILSCFLMTFSFYFG